MSTSDLNIHKNGLKTPEIHYGVAKQAVEMGIHDIHQQIWVLQEKSLIATPHNGDVIPVTLAIQSCRNEDSLEKNKGNPIYIGIKDQNLCLYCEKNQEHAILKLEDKNVMDLYNSDKAQKPFVFYHKKTGSTSTFESAACPGWFICTSNNMGEPVKMTKELGNQNNTDFYLRNNG
ncbi:interleukin-36 alpha-like isoform X1 [Macrotis lagotis]|uniref:interleukin-36 alpha-like isoform X1 n=1 Tax=Macrotis lagotis TaxID=92651 RepID=UPI003D685E92